MMAPISRVTANSYGLNDLKNGGFDPPPSTMAAQLINNISTVNKPSRPAEQDDLQKLMAEVSELENNSTKLGRPEIKVQHKHKLIYVFARAVLEKLSQDDPFMNVQQMVAQASDALDIFMTTIKENPNVLDYVLEPEENLRTRGREPLWIWLFPKLLVLLGRRECETLTEKIKDFFYVSFQAVAQSPRLWNLSSFFFFYLKECATSMYNPINALAPGSDRLSSSFGPSSETRGHL
jgi:serine/threonine-protein kinase ATR